MALVVPVSVLQQVGALRFPLQDSLDWLFVGSVCSALGGDCPAAGFGKGRVLPGLWQGFAKSPGNWGCAEVPRARKSLLLSHSGAAAMALMAWQR